ncbi:hypothetical protein [Bacillus sp. Au-Bac7]|uniref:hypothetical protein n=1 Tax=Bacillus sp. Au-Bac7 TaxID=2906458 RepID=UPI001E4B921A|nr:hypothetical protein [Bacillus sp. Au-Bac7]MCE4051850.1 hypothetical protein [Bacillus sp. Au-Bac7]
MGKYEEIKAIKAKYEKVYGKKWWHDDADEVYEEIKYLAEKFNVSILQAYSLYNQLEESKIENGSFMDDYYLEYAREEGLLDDDEEWEDD